MSRTWIDVAVPRRGDPADRRRQAARPPSHRSLGELDRRGRHGDRDRLHVLDRGGRLVLADAGGIAVGSVVGVLSARAVKMTQIPQMVALFNGVGGGAAALIAGSRVPPARAGVRAGSAARAARRDPLLGGDRVGQLLGLARRVREAAGADHRAAARLPGPEPVQRCARRSCSSRSSR